MSHEPGCVAADRAARAAFLHRRKSLLRSLAAAGIPTETIQRALGALEIDPGLRPEVISPQEFVKIGVTLGSTLV